MLVDIRQIVFMLRALKGKFPCNMLVFGLGWDALMWSELNKGGHTVFFEDDAKWLKRIAALGPTIEARHITYPTKISEWQSLLNRPERLEIKLDGGVDKTKWDVIFVDGPYGGPLEYYKGPSSDGPPGRMSSIYLASRLIREGGDVFIDDCEREIEGRYADTYFGKKRLVSEIKSKTTLRWYAVQQPLEEDICEDSMKRPGRPYGDSRRTR